MMGSYVDKVKLSLTEAKTEFNKNFQLKLIFDQIQRFDFFPCLLGLPFSFELKVLLVG